MGQFHSFAFFSTLFASFVTVHSFQHHLLERLSFPILFSCCLSCKLADHTHLSLFLGSLFSSIDLCLFFFFNALQNFVVFCHTSRISHRYTYVPSLPNSPHISLPIPPFQTITEPLFESPESHSKFSFSSVQLLSRV